MFRTRFCQQYPKDQEWWHPLHSQFKICSGFSPTQFHTWLVGRHFDDSTIWTQSYKIKATFHTVIQYCMSSLSSSFHMFIFFNPKQRKKKIVRPLARSNELWAMKYLGLHCHFFSPWHDGHQRRMCFHLTVSKMSIALKVKEVPLLGLFLSVSSLKARQTFVTWSYSIKFLSTTELSQSYSEVRYMESMLNEEDDKQSRTPPLLSEGICFSMQMLHSGSSLSVAPGTWHEMKWRKERVVLDTFTCSFCVCMLEYSV